MGQTFAIDGGKNTNTSLARCLAQMALPAVLPHRGESLLAAVLRQKTNDFSGPDASGFSDGRSAESSTFTNPNTGVDPRVRAHAPNLIGATLNVADCFQQGEYFMGTWNLMALGWSTGMLCATGGLCTVTVQASPDGRGPPRLGFSIGGLFGVGN